MNRISETEKKVFVEPNRPMTIREMAIRNLIERKQIQTLKKEKMQKFIRA